MIESCVTVSLVPEARGGPFVFWHDLPAACRKAESLGYDAIEIFTPSGDAVAVRDLASLLEDHRLKLAAVGTGAGWVVQRLSLTSPDAGRRDQARDFIRRVIDLGAPFGASAIIGSMQGRWSDVVDRQTAIGYLADALDELGEYAAGQNVPLVYEPLNRYETNLVNTVAAGVALLESLSTRNVKLLADLFHMNIEEASVADALRSGGDWIGHLHFVDSNRRPAGLGHLDYAPIVSALQQIGYDGYASAEALPYPDPDAAARQTMETYRDIFQ